MELNPVERVEQLLGTLQESKRQEMTAGLGDKIWKSIRHEKAPSRIVRPIATYATLLLASASVIAVLNAAYLVGKTSQQKKDTSDAASMLIDTYQLDELNNNL